MLFETKKLTPNMTAICVNTARVKGYPSFEAMVHHYPANNARHGVEVAQIKGQLREYNNGGGYITELVVKIRLAKSELTAKRLAAVLDDAYLFAIYQAALYFGDDPEAKYPLWTAPSPSNTALPSDAIEDAIHNADGFGEVWRKRLVSTLSVIISVGA